MEHTSKRRMKAFTLVELLVVVGIIALLVSMLLPALNKVREQAATVECAAQLRQVGFAWLQYQNDNDGWIAPMSRRWCDSWADNINFTLQNTATTQNPSEMEFRWFNYLERFVKDYRIFNCPTANQNRINGSTGVDTQVKQSGGDGTSNSIGRGYCRAGLASNYSYAASVLGRWEETPAPTGLSNAKGTPNWVLTDPNYFAAFGPKKMQQAMVKYRTAGGGTTNCVVAMDGAWWVVDTSTNLDGINYARRYIHSKQRANSLFADGHVDAYQKASYKTVYVTNSMVILAK